MGFQDKYFRIITEFRTPSSRSYSFITTFLKYLLSLKYAQNYLFQIKLATTVSQMWTATTPSYKCNIHSFSLVLITLMTESSWNILQLHLSRLFLEFSSSDNSSYLGQWLLSCVSDIIYVLLFISGGIGWPGQGLHNALVFNCWAWQIWDSLFHICDAEWVVNWSNGNDWARCFSSSNRFIHMVMLGYRREACKISWNLDL